MGDERTGLEEEQAIHSIEQGLSEQAEMPVSPPTWPPTRSVLGKVLPWVNITTAARRIGDWLAVTLRDPIWQGIAGVIAIIALVVSFLLWPQDQPRHQRQPPYLRRCRPVL